MNAHRPIATARLIVATTVMCNIERERNEAGPPGAAEWCERFLR